MVHPLKGYSGPLSRHLLAYQCLVSSMRSCLRDLIESVLATLFLESDAERVREDFLQIAEEYCLLLNSWLAHLLTSARLPFRDDFSAGLGVLTKTYLDELGLLEKPMEETQKGSAMHRVENWLIHTDVTGSFKRAGELWDAFYEGVRSASPKCIKDDERKRWREVDQWFQPCKFASNGNTGHA